MLSPNNHSCSGEKLTLPQIDDILELLKSGRWHELKEIAEKAQLPEFKIELIANFLEEYRFIKLDRKHQRTKLTPQMLSFLKKIDDLEKEPLEDD